MSPRALLIAAVALLGVASARAQNFTLPQLPFPYTATEPAIDRNTTEIHWTRCWLALVDSSLVIRGTTTPFLAGFKPKTCSCLAMPGVVISSPALIYG
mgnify:CR=1 FL=1